jgi:hypothetical protein
VQRRNLLLVGLLLIAAAVAYVTWPESGPSSVPAGGSAAGGAGAAGGRGDSGVADVKLELLQRERGPLRGLERNPFRFERRTSEVAAARAATTRRVVPVELPPAGPLPPPPPPPIPLRFIGFLQPVGGADRVAVLSDGRGNVFNGKEGDIIEGRYRLLRVGNDSADLIYVDGRGRQTIRLSGQ